MAPAASPAAKSQSHNNCFKELLILHAEGIRGDGNSKGVAFVLMCIASLSWEVIASHFVENLSCFWVCCLRHNFTPLLHILL